jgi:hypothetical protein
MKRKRSESKQLKERKKDEALKKVIRKHVSAISDKVNRDTGKKVNIIKNKKEATISVFNEIKSSNLYKIFNQQESYTSEEDFQKSLIGFLAGIGVAEFLHRTNGKVSLIDYVTNQLKNLFEVSKTSYLQSTNATKYRNALFGIVDDIIAKNLLKDVSTYLKLIPEDDLIDLRQQIFKLQMKYVPMFYKNIKRVTYDTIESYQHVYEEGAGAFETYIKFNYFVNKNLEGKQLAYQNVINTEAWDVKKYLIQDRNYEVLLEPFKTIVWNSIKHKKIKRDTKNKKVTFHANKPTLELTYLEFIKLTKNLYAALDTLSKFRYAIILRQIELNKEGLKSK